MTAVVVGVLRETGGERRVALDPKAVSALTRQDRSVLVETGAGIAASFPDADYEVAGAVVSSREVVLQSCDVLAVVHGPDDGLTSTLRSGQMLIGLLDPLNNLTTIGRLADAGVTTVAFELLPRTLSRAQTMDALSSQSSAAGYRAAIVAAEAFGRYLPMMITASGTATPAKVMVIGAGVAGLQAIATTKRLGAVVTGYDVREASRAEVESLGATFLTRSVSQEAADDGYAMALSPEEQTAQQAELAHALTSFDVIITTAKVPGRTPPVLVSAETLATLRHGSVCIDLGSSDQGGNVVGSVDGQRTTTAGGVTVIGAGELASDLPTSASQMYARNVVAVISSLVPHGEVVIDPTDEIHAAIVVTHQGAVTNAALRSAMKLEPPSDASTPVGSSATARARAS